MDYNSSSVGNSDAKGEPNMTKEIVIDFLKTHKDDFTQKYHISKMALFGSFARGEHHP